MQSRCPLMKWWFRERPILMLSPIIVAMAGIDSTCNWPEYIVFNWGDLGASWWGTSQLIWGGFFWSWLGSHFLAVRQGLPNLVWIRMAWPYDVTLGGHLPNFAPSQSCVQSTQGTKYIACCVCVVSFDAYQFLQDLGS